jgi:hypothetical protein
MEKCCGGASAQSAQMPQNNNIKTTAEADDDSMHAGTPHRIQFLREIHINIYM